MLPRSSNLARYGESFAAPALDAYETLLWNVMKNDASLFLGADQVEAIWWLLMPVLEAWGTTHSNDFPNYAAGGWGPGAVQGRLARQEHRWPEPAELVKPGDSIFKQHSVSRPRHDRPQDALWPLVRE